MNPSIARQIVHDFIKRHDIAKFKFHSNPENIISLSFGEIMGFYLKIHIDSGKIKLTMIHFHKTLETEIKHRNLPRALKVELEKAYENLI